MFCRVMYRTCAAALPQSLFVGGLAEFFSGEESEQLSGTVGQLRRIHGRARLVLHTRHSNGVHVAEQVP